MSQVSAWKPPLAGLATFLVVSLALSLWGSKFVTFLGVVVGSVAVCMIAASTYMLLREVFRHES